MAARRAGKAKRVRHFPRGWRARAPRPPSRGQAMPAPRSEAVADRSHDPSPASGDNFASVSYLTLDLAVVRNSSVTSGGYRTTPPKHPTETYHVRQDPDRRPHPRHDFGRADLQGLRRPAERDLVFRARLAGDRRRQLIRAHVG